MRLNCSSAFIVDFIGSECNRKQCDRVLPNIYMIGLERVSTSSHLLCHSDSWKVPSVSVLGSVYFGRNAIFCVRTLSLALHNLWRRDNLVVIPKMVLHFDSKNLLGTNLSKIQIIRINQTSAILLLAFSL